MEINKIAHILDDPIRRNAVKRLTRADFAVIEGFLVETLGKNKGEVSVMASRFFMDKKDKPKNWTVIDDILITYASSL